MRKSPADPPCKAAAPAASAAFFDVDGTLVSTHIVHQYIFVRDALRRRNGAILPGVRQRLWLGGFLVKCLHYLYLDRVSRTRMNIAFYRNYRGLDCASVREAAEACFDSVLKPHMFARGVDCVRAHLAAGRHVVLLTGSIDFFIEPLAHYLSALHHGEASVELLARTLIAQEGRFTGALDGPPLGENAKADAMQEFAEHRGIDLAQCYAYGDSIADKPMLEAVGHPHAVNADKILTAYARAQDWPICLWDRDGYAP